MASEGKFSPDGGEAGVAWGWLLETGGIEGEGLETPDELFGGADGLLVGLLELSIGARLLFILPRLPYLVQGEFDFLQTAIILGIIF